MCAMHSESSEILCVFSWITENEWLTNFYFILFVTFKLWKGKAWAQNDYLGLEQRVVRGKIGHFVVPSNTRTKNSI